MRMLLGTCLETGREDGMGAPRALPKEKVEGDRML